MRKLIIAVASVMALAVVPSIASADVPRCAAPVTSTTGATFSFDNPAGAVGQWDNVWHNVFTVTVAPDGSFTGTGIVTGHDQITNLDVTGAPEAITGKFDSANNAVSYTVSRPGYDTLTYSVVDAPTNGTTVTIATPNTPQPWIIETKNSAPVFTAATTTDMNHGEYVSSQGGGKVAAQKCAGMPLNSKQGK
jgi:hypothetical protein